jgi:hypothetical protein
VRRACAPVHVVLACPDGTDDPDARVVVYGVNDTPVPVEGTLRYGAMRFDGTARREESVEVVLAPGASTPIASFPVSDWRKLDESGPGGSTPFARSAAYAVLVDADGRVAARGRLILPRYCELDLLHEPVVVSRDADSVLFECPVFTLGVCLDLTGREAMGDDFFDLWPGIPHRVPWADDRALPEVLFTANPMIRKEGWKG